MTNPEIDNAPKKRGRRKKVVDDTHVQVDLSKEKVKKRVSKNPHACYVDNALAMKMTGSRTTVRVIIKDLLIKKCYITFKMLFKGC